MLSREFAHRPCCHMNLHTVLAHMNTDLRDLAWAGGEQGLPEEGKRRPTERWGAENKPSGKGPHTHLGRLERDPLPQGPRPPPPPTAHNTGDGGTCGHTPSLLTSHTLAAGGDPSHCYPSDVTGSLPLMSHPEVLTDVTPTGPCWHYARFSPRHPPFQLLLFLVAQMQMAQRSPPTYTV